MGVLKLFVNRLFKKNSNTIFMRKYKKKAVKS